jgi:hypothetical protein
MLTSLGSAATARYRKAGRHRLATRPRLGRLGGIFTSPPAVVSWGRTAPDIFGLGGDGAIPQGVDGTAWRPSLLDWERLGGIFTARPSCLGQNRLDIFGLGGDGACTQGVGRHRLAALAFDWERLGGIHQPPAVTAWGQGLDIFGLGGAVRCIQSVGRLRLAAVALDWERPGQLTSPPVAAWGLNRLDIFGLGGDGAIITEWDGSAWRPSP